jgi:hypothetical protein
LVTVPVAFTDATVASLLLHRPPAAASVRVILEPVHTVVGPLIVPATGAGLMVTGVLVDAVAQPVVTVYVILVMPAVTPVTTPDASTLAMAALPLLHTPPADVSVRVLVVP